MTLSSSRNSDCAIHAAATVNLHKLLSRQAGLASRAQHYLPLNHILHVQVNAVYTHMYSFEAYSQGVCVHILFRSQSYSKVEPLNWLTTNNNNVAYMIGE